MFNRTNKGLISEWWWTIDRWLLTLVGLLMLVGLLLCMAASPAVAERLGLGSFHFVTRQVVYAGLALIALIGGSLLSLRQTRRAALLVGIGAFALMGLALVMGLEVKGAARWVHIAGVSIQPSEFVKPAFVVVCAWLFSEQERVPDMPGKLLAFGLYAALAAALMLQPDFGQTVLVTAVWGLMLFLTGLPWLWIGSLALAAVAGLVAVYLTVPHVALRIDRHFSPESGDTFQVDIALEAISRGGWLGVGPGEGTIKQVLPDAHADFIFAVAGEEYGIVLCLILVVLYALIVMRVLARALGESDPFIKLAATGLVSLFGLQAIINMAVSLSLVPAKGMTLPLVSYGGSSLIATGLAMGLLLSLTRRRPGNTLPRQIWRASGQPEPA